ncbi:MAG TPA: aspartyl-phosphate phosphatase Spo0E family protein [Candidatus Atribacteria bacterium]|nr:aspartyl-phosphate phosphatase Spo0E family protein [Candidatus Atribacteria bacterium]
MTKEIIDALRKDLEDKINEKGSLTDEEVLEISRKLDELITQYNIIKLRETT